MSPSPCRRADAVDAHVGARLRQAREAAGLSRRQLAARAAVNAPILARYERGISRIPASHLFRLARALDLRVDALFAGLAAESNLAAERANGPEEHEARDFAAHVLAISDPGLRRDLMGLIRAVAAGRHRDDPDPSGA